MKNSIVCMIIVLVSFSAHSMEQHRQVALRRNSSPVLLTRPYLRLPSAKKLTQAPSAPQPETVKIDILKAKKEISQALMQASEGCDSSMKNCCCGCLCGCISGLVVAAGIAAVYEACIGHPAEAHYRENLAMLSSAFGAVAGVGAADSANQNRVERFTQECEEKAERILGDCQEPQCQIRKRYSAQVAAANFCE